MSYCDHFNTEQDEFDHTYCTDCGKFLYLTHDRKVR